MAEPLSELSLVPLFSAVLAPVFASVSLPAVLPELPPQAARARAIVRARARASSLLVMSLFLFSTKFLQKEMP